LIRSADSESGEGKGCKAGYGGPMLKASFGSDFCASRASPDMRTQPRLMPPAAGVWMENSCFWGRGEAKKVFDFAVISHADLVWGSHDWGDVRG
jgi:hypothetical protein